MREELAIEFLQRPQKESKSNAKQSLYRDFRGRPISMLQRADRTGKFRINLFISVSPSPIILFYYSGILPK